MNDFTKAVLVYFAAVSLFSAVLTVYDKTAAKKFPRRRIRERTLLLAGFFGGAAAELFFMLLIRHKTRHKKFMLLLPLFIVLHIAEAVFFFSQ